jgi:YidC/Oxa1 family membrane protein insertase
MSQSMMVTMPLMFGFFAMQMPAGLSIYFIVSNLVGIGITWLTNRWLNGDQAEETASARRPAVSTTTVPEDKPDRKSKKSGYRKRGYRRRK